MSVDSWLGTSVNLIQLLAFGGAAVGLLAGLTFSTSVVLANRRRRTIVRALRAALGQPRRLDVRRRAQMWQRTKAITDRRARGEHLLVSDELSWLVDLVRLATGSDSEPPLPLAFHPALDTADRAVSLESLSAAYERYAVASVRPWFLRDLSRNVGEKESSTAEAVAASLRSLAATAPVPRRAAPSDVLPYELPGSRTFDLGPGIDRAGAPRPRRVALVTWHHGHGQALHYPLITCSYEPLRYDAPAERGGELPAQPVRPATARPLEALAPHEGHTTGALDYDGVLTRLHRVQGAASDSPQRLGFREEHDPFSGRRRLHLSLSEVMFTAVKATHYDLDLPVDAPTAELVTLSLICLDPNGVAVLVERSRRLGTNPHGFASTVSGNGELAQREGITPDLDQRGLPDLLAATAREAEEEVGLTLGREHDHLGALGLHTITSESERGTHVLTLVSRLALPAETWVPDMQANDPIEGAWELGDHLMTIDLPRLKRDAPARERFFSWLKTDSRMATHAVGGLLMILLANADKDATSTERLLSEFEKASPYRARTLPKGVAVRRWRHGECDHACPWDSNSRAARTKR